MAHTACRKGTPVWVRLTTGDQFRDHFEDRVGRFVVFRERGRIAKRLIRSFSLTLAKSRRNGDGWASG